MTDSSRHDAWQSGDSYDAYMGRWSRRIAPAYLRWLDQPAGLHWLEIGCGTGALSAAIIDQTEPRNLQSIDPSEDFVAKARANVPDTRASFHVGDAQALAFESGSRDVIVSGLVLNFVPDKAKAIGEMKRVVRKGGLVSFYVWDYPGGGLEFLSAFWNAAAELDESAADLTEDRRFPDCTPQGLEAWANAAGLSSVDLTAIEVPTVFRDFEDYWRPFTLGAGPAPGYCSKLDPEARERLRSRLDATLPRQPDGTIHLKARAWAAKARVE